MKKMMMALVAATGLASASVPAMAQTQNGLVTVNVSDIEILRNSLNNNNVEVLNNFLNNNQVALPISIQVPIGVAANVCNTTVAVLSAAASGGQCTARQASTALGQAFVKQQRKQ